MSNTGNRILDGTQFTNVSIELDDCGLGGSLEVADTVYVNRIEEYDLNTGVTLEQSIFQGGTAIITSTQPAINKTTASLIVNGGAVIYSDTLLYGIINFVNTSNSSSVTSGSVIITGGVGIQKNLNIGGITTLFNTTTSDNSNMGSIVLYGGLSINNTTDASSFTQGGDLTIAGGASIAKTLFANILNSNTTFITNANLLYSNTINQTTTNLLASNISTNTLNAINSTISNSYIINSYINFNTVSNSYILNSNITFSSISNLQVSNGNIYSFNSIIGNIVGLTVANLNVTNEISYTEVITYSSTANFINTFSTINSLQLSSGTFGSLYGNSLTTTSLLINGTIDSINSTTGTIILNFGGLSINNTANATSFTSGGAETIAGGLAVGKNVYIGGFLDVNSNNIFNMTAPSLDFNNTVASVGLVAANKWYVDSRFNQFTIGNISGNISQGQVVIGGTGGNITSYPSFTFNGNLLSLNSTIDATSLTNGGTLQVYGGASINKQLFVGGNTYILGYLDMNNQKITSLDTPTMPYDAANKYYVDNTIANGFTTSNIYVTNLSSGTINASGVTFGNINFTGLLYQNGVPYISSQWNGTTGTTLYYGTTGSGALVGIGTSNPSYTLDVRGTTNISGSLTAGALYTSLSTITNLVTTNLSSGTINASGVTFGNINFTGQLYQNSVLYVNSQWVGTTGTTLYYGTTGSGALVGIGTSNPSYTLDIQGTTNISGSLTAGALYSSLSTITNMVNTNTSSGTYSGTAATIGNIVATSVSSGIYALTVLGESSFLGKVYFSNSIDLNNQVINNVTSPSLDLQVANKYYVDNRFNEFTIGNVSGNFTQGQVIVATTGGNITGFSNFLFDGNLLSLTSTNQALGLGTGGALTVIGGLSVGKNAYIGGFLDMNSNNIFNITAPSLNFNNTDVSIGLVATNKWYVDTRFNQFTVGNISGNISAGQIVIGISGGNIASYPEFTFDNNTDTVNINSTNNSLGLGTGGALNIVGGASILGNVYIGSGLDLNNNIITSVALPINPADAVNKEYVDYYTGFNPGDIRERSFVLNNNVNTPTDVTGFVFLNTQISSFEAIVYLQIPEISIYDQWEIHGLLKGNVWIINTPFIGDHPSRVKFTITNSGQIQYTNENTTGTATIRFRAYTTSQGLYTNTTVANNLRSVPFGGTGTDFFTHGTLLIGNGTNAINTNINLRFTSGTLFVGNTTNSIGINAGGTIITNVTAPTLSLDVANKWYVDQATLGFSNNTYTNLIATNATVTTLNVGNLTTGNILVSGNITVAGNLIVLGTLTSINITTVNLVETNVSAGLLNAGSATITNLITTNISTGTINSTGLTTGNINFTGSLYQNGVPYLGSQWTGSVGSTISYTSGNVLVGTTLTSTNTTTINLVATNSTINNAFISNANITTLSLANLVVTNETFSNLIGINANISNITVSNQVSLNETIGSLRATNINTLTFTSGNAIITNNITSKNILITGTTNANNILTIDCFSSQTFGGQILFRNSTGTGDFRVFGDGGDVQWLGGGGRAMQFGSFHQVIISGGRNSATIIPQVGGNGTTFNCQILNINNSIGLQVRGVAAQTVDLQQWINSANTVLSRVDFLGRIGINSTTLATGQSTTGSLYTLGGATINQNLYVNSTINSTSTTTGGLIVNGGVGIIGNVNIGGNLVVNNLSSLNITTTNLLSTNSSTSNLSSLNITTTNLSSTNSSTSNLSSLNITTTNLSSLNITTSNLSSLNITTTNLLSSSITTTNLVSTNITTSNLSIINLSTTNITSTNILSNFITSSNILSTNFTSSNVLSTNISSSNISTSNMFINNVNMTPSTGDLFKEQLFNASDNVLTPDSITGFVFNNNVRYFTGWLSIFITASTNIITAFTIEGIQLNAGVWEINTRFIGKNSQIKLSITNAGQIQYTCPGIPGFVSSVMKFRAITTTV